MRSRWILLSLALFPTLLQAEEETFVYLTGLTPESARIAWGTAGGGGNTIGRQARPLGPVEVRIDGRVLIEEHSSWLVAEQLEPDQDYDYQVRVGERILGRGILRTFPRRTERMAFLLIGDYGKGNDTQRSLGRAMWKTVQRQRDEGNPIRFVLTAGDNVYGSFFYQRNTGGRDKHWRKRFFEPFRDLLLHVPFYPALGNHDGGETESSDDLPVYLDNFFLPPPGSEEGSNGRYYSFSLGGLAQFFILDSTKNQWEGEGFIYQEGGPQHRWLQGTLSACRSPWKVAVFHNPTYNAGPRYEDRDARFDYLEQFFAERGIQAVFSGHEHNFQASDPARTSGIRYIISGGGSDPRDKNIVKDLKANRMALWSPKAHFLLIEIEDSQMQITALGKDAAPVMARTAENASVPARVTIPRQR